MPDFSKLLERNRAWVEAKGRSDPEFFRKLAQGQDPDFLFVGCSDSRKSINKMLGTEPGDLFIHRNIANQVQLTDGNVQAILEFALLNLKVRHVIIGGHTRCGGVKAALEGVEEGAVGAWLTNLRALAALHAPELAAIRDPAERADRLSEINVMAQARNVLLSGPYKEAKVAGHAPTVHGWIFELQTGLIRELELPEDEWRRDGLL